MNKDGVNRWRKGIRTMAALPQVYIKISMLGYVVPNWIVGSQNEQDVLVALVQEAVETFGPSRCMVGLNWWRDASTSDEGGDGSVGPTPLEFLHFLASKCFGNYSDEDRYMLFAGTAKRFYKLA
ncbi:hypothetical protein MPSEU_000876000 [Mayamaea pseudoterrestris]|nr:hypothetical protein MPSEU_000876000 [Mayamaea pseudoterrestris]